MLYWTCHCASCHTELCAAGTKDDLPNIAWRSSFTAWVLCGGNIVTKIIFVPVANSSVWHQVDYSRISSAVLYKDGDLTNRFLWKQSQSWLSKKITIPFYSSKWQFTNQWVTSHIQVFHDVINERVACYYCEEQHKLSWHWLPNATMPEGTTSSRRGRWGINDTKPMNGIKQKQ